MSDNFLGGIRARSSRRAPAPGAVREDWGWIGERTELFARGAASCGRLFRWDHLALFLRGYARSGDGPLDLERVADDLRRSYLESDTLAVDGLDGCFTAALLDSRNERVILYRNLVGSGSTYYHAACDGLVFGGNLVELVDAIGGAEPNEAVLPSFFVYRCVPGRETLFRDVYRLLPGEELTWEDGEVTRRRRHDFSDLRGDTIKAADAPGLVEDTMTAILKDCAAFRPQAANLLSGGVDSSFIQAMWARAVPGADEMPPSFSVSVDHPHTWQDTDYAITASQAIGTRHVLVPADGAYSSYLLDALGATGEPMNHVQSAYFGHLARAMKGEGATAGVCGEGADSLFGVGMANQIHNARVMRKALPFAWMRSLAGGVAGAARMPLLARVCRIANVLDDVHRNTR